MIKDLHTLPTNLPVPMDDGACDHLLGSVIPPVSLISTSGNNVILANHSIQWTPQPYPMWYEPERGLYFQRGMSLKRRN